MASLKKLEIFKIASILIMMIVAQYLANTKDGKDSIIAIAELIGCEYRVSGMIIAVFITNCETLKIIKRGQPLPNVLVE